MTFLCKLIGCKIPDVIMRSVYTCITKGHVTGGLFGCDRCGRIGKYSYDSTTKKITRI